jgi:hypothetical protein
MPKISANYPSISALQALIYIYSKLKKIPRRGDISESKYIEYLSSALANDNLLKGNASKNMVYKLIGNPPQSRPDLTDAIEPSKLDAIAKYIFDHTPELKDRIGEQNIVDYWVTFKEKAFPMPPHFYEMQARNYFKFLTDLEKNAINGYIQRKMNEYGLYEDVMTYSVHVWSHPDRFVRAPILQINLAQNFATYTIFTKVNGKQEIKAVMRTDLAGGYIKLSSNTLFIFLTNENALNPVRASFYFAIHDLGFNSLKYMKGILSFSAFNITVPTATKIILKKQDNYLEAFKLTSDTNDVEDSIVFDLINQRMEVRDENLSELSKLSSNRIHEVVKAAAGYYRFGYIAAINHFNKEGILSIGNGQIKENGMVYLNFPHHRKPMQAHISNNHFHGADVLEIRQFVDSGLDEFKFNYDLKAKRNPLKFDNNFGSLEGYYSGFYTNVPAAGKIVFLKISEKDEDFKEQKDFRGSHGEGHEIKDKLTLEICDLLKISHDMSGIITFVTTQPQI